MVKITDRAKEELRRVLQTRRLETGKRLRLATAPVWPGEDDFGIVIDAEKEDDYVVEFEGEKVLLIEAGLMESLESAVVDFKESPEGARFTVDVY